MVSPLAAAAAALEVAVAEVDAAGAGATAWASSEVVLAKASATEIPLRGFMGGVVIVWGCIELTGRQPATHAYIRRRLRRAATNGDKQTVQLFGGYY